MGRELQSGYVSDGARQLASTSARSVPSSWSARCQRPGEQGSSCLAGTQSLGQERTDQLIIRSWKETLSPLSNTEGRKKSR